MVKIAYRLIIVIRQWTILRQLGELLVDIHGQHANQVITKTYKAIITY